jgi:hypothetical protein
VLKFIGGVAGVVETIVDVPARFITSKVSPATGAAVKKLLAAVGVGGHVGDPGGHAGFTRKLRLKGA